MKKPWFKAKNYGWGWQPSSKEGWMVLVGFLAVAYWIFRDADTRSHSASDTLYGVVIPFFVLTAALLAVCWKTGEKPEWRWGGKPLWKKKD